MGNRDAESTLVFMQDIEGRIANRIQLTSDGYKPYLKAVDEKFDGHIDFAQLVKVYGSSKNECNAKRYSSAEFLGIKKIVIEGRPDVDHISTSYVERQNLTMRMHM